jgi:dephospho-CoA kinase
MFRVGITGGIGSGKTTVAEIFKVLGIPVYYADDAAKRLMNEDPALRSSLIALLGADIYRDGRLDRAVMAAKIFADKSLLEKVNAIVHPVTIADGASWMEKQHAPYAIKEAALIFESGVQRDLDFIIGVYAPETLRIHRVMQRNGWSREEVKKRIASQLSETIKMKLCDAVVTNDEQRLLIPQVLALHQQLLKLADSD